MKTTFAVLVCTLSTSCLVTPTESPEATQEAVSADSDYVEVPMSKAPVIQVCACQVLRTSGSKSYWSNYELSQYKVSSATFADPNHMADAAKCYGQCYVWQAQTSGFLSPILVANLTLAPSVLY